MRSAINPLFRAASSLASAKRGSIYDYSKLLTIHCILEDSDSG